MRIESTPGPTHTNHVLHVQYENGRTEFDGAKHLEFMS